MNIFIFFLLISLIAIHSNSHFLSDEWVQISESEALDFYSAREVCLIVGGDRCDVEPGTVEPVVPNEKCR